MYPSPERKPGPEGRLVVATHTRTSSDPAVFVERDGIVYELFVSTLPSPACTAADILELYLHRGSFETVLADPRPGARDGSLVLPYPVWPGMCPDPRSMGLERIERELGQQLSPSELRTTEFAPAHEAEPSSTNESESPAAPPHAVTSGPAALGSLIVTDLPEFGDLSLYVPDGYRLLFLLFGRQAFVFSN